MVGYGFVSRRTKLNLTAPLWFLNGIFTHLLAANEVDTQLAVLTRGLVECPAFLDNIVQVDGTLRW